MTTQWTRLIAFALFAAAASSVSVSAPSIRAASAVEHAKVRLTVRSPHAEQTVFTDQTPPEIGKNPRPVLEAKVGDPLKIEYLLTNVYPHKTLENVVLHFYVVRADKVGQKTLPDLNEKNVILRNACDLDLKPGAKSGGQAALSINKPGVYIVRIESRNTHSDHEHFSAIDLVITP